VETGWRFGDQVEIIKGLAPGERIAVSGNFLIDSESRMKAPAAAIASATAADPACGHVVDTGKARKSGLISTYHEKTYYFWSSECKQQFDKDPELVLARSAQGRNANTGAEKEQPKQLRKTWFAVIRLIGQGNDIRADEHLPRQDLLFLLQRMQAAIRQRPGAHPQAVRIRPNREDER
jgi:YHS domain-containing protein